MMTVDEALRHERDRLPFELEMVSIDAMETLAAEVRRLREENERLRAVLESACEKMKQCRYVEARSDMLQAIDAVRGGK